MKTLKKFHAIFATDCFQLVKIVLKVGEWSVFANLEEIQGLKEVFKIIELKHIPMT